MSNTKSNKVTNKDVAALAGVSVATVSYVVNGRTDKRISEETTKKVLHAINILCYSPNPHATAIKTNTRDIIIRSSKNNSSLQNAELFAFLKEFTEVCVARDYKVTLSAETQPQRIAASACVCMGLDNNEFHTLANENFIPLVAVDSLLNDPVFYQISNNYESIRELAEKHFGNDYLYVALCPNNTPLKEELLSTITNTILISTISDLRNIPDGNIVVTDKILMELLKDKVKLNLCDRISNKPSCILDCIEKAINRESVPDEMHFIKL